MYLFFVLFWFFLNNINSSDYGTYKDSAKQSYAEYTMGSSSVGHKYLQYIYWQAVNQIRIFL